jgi:hypothetical protein
MTASVVKLEWHKPKIEVLETVGPFRCCKMFTLYDGRKIIAPGTPPIVTVTNRNPLVIAIADHVGSLAFTIKDLKRHAKVVKGPLLAAIGDIDLGNEFKKLNDRWFDGYRLKNIGAAGQGVALWRIERLG